MLSEIRKNIIATELALKDENKRHENTVSSLSKQLIELQKEQRLCAANFDLDKINLAKKIIKIEGKYKKSGDDGYSCLKDAIDCLSKFNEEAPKSKLIREYFGTKNYAHWYGQRFDCSYGMGPTHGSIIFSIGLNRDIQKELREKREESKLTDDELESSLYYLINLEEIQKQEELAVQ